MTHLLAHPQPWQVDLRDGLSTGTVVNDASIHPYVRMGYGMMHVNPLSKTSENTLLLSMIAIPPSLRRQGMATRIVAYLEARAARENVRFAVGPIMEDADGTAHMATICSRRGYKGCMPWCYYQPRGTDVNCGGMLIMSSADGL